MIQRSVIKRKTKQQLKGKLLLSIAVLVLAQVLSNLDLFTPEFFANMNFFSPEFYNLDTTEPSHTYTTLRIISFLLSGVMSVSTARYCLNLIDDKEEVRFSDILSGFGVFIKALALHIIMTLAIMLGTVLLIVPGIIISLMFSQAYYILCENNDKSIIQCLVESTKMMNGHKLELFVLQLSFVGWLLLVIVTLGIAALWVEPYMQMTFTNYYLELKSASSDDVKVDWYMK